MERINKLQRPPALRRSLFWWPALMLVAAVQVLRTDAFSTLGLPRHGLSVGALQRKALVGPGLCLVTEQDVLDAVEHAEELWSQALEARKTANALSDRAEEEAEAAAESSKEVDDLFRRKRGGPVAQTNGDASKGSKTNGTGEEAVVNIPPTPISMEDLARADAAAKSNLDAGSMVNKALRASDEADRLEQLAEEALQKTEQTLEQHLQDFPDSPLGQDGDEENETPEEKPEED